MTSSRYGTRKRETTVFLRATTISSKGIGAAWKTHDARHDSL